MCKKVLSVLLAGTMVMGLLAGCGSAAEETTTTEETPVVEESADVEETADAVVEESADASDYEEVALEDATVKFFAAASLQSVMEEVIEAYNAHHDNITIEGSYDSSGTLLEQIENGAACDVFFSAAQKQMDTLQNDDQMVVEGTRYNIVNNQVCVVVAAGTETDCTGIDTLDLAESLAIADGSVPVGKYTRKALIAEGILDETDTPEDYTTEQLSEALGGIEINECGNVSKVRDAVIENPGQVGTVYLSDTYGHEDELDIIEQVSYDLTGDIIYPVAQITNDEADEAEEAAAADFINFIKSSEAKAIFDKYLFDTDVEQ